MIGAAVQKDVWLLLRDRGALLGLFALPIVFMSAFGAMFDVDRDSARTIAIWHAPEEPRGVAIAHALAGTPGFAPARHASSSAVRAAIAAGEADAGLIVMADAIEIVVEPGLPVQVRAPLEGALDNLVVRALVPASVALPRVTVTSSRGSDRATSFQVAVPGNAVLFTFFLALTVAMSFANERRLGTWQRLLAAPVSRREVLAGMLVPYFFVGVVQLAVFFSVGVFVFGMTIAGSVAALVVLSLALVFCAVALGLLFAALGGSERQLGGFGAVALLVMGMVGGCMVPRLVMSPEMQAIGLAVPHGWALDGYHDVLVREGTVLADVAPALAALLLFGIAFSTIGLALFRVGRL